MRLHVERAWVDGYLGGCVQMLVSMVFANQSQRNVDTSLLGREAACACREVLMHVCEQCVCVCVSSVCVSILFQ
jgi:hypothetical protein